MQDWRTLFQQHRYKEIRYLELPRLEQAELLGALRAIVPTTGTENGIEKLVRFKRPSEIPERSVRDAARILELGELEGEVAGEPPSARDIWAEERDVAERYVGDVPEGEPEFGPQAKDISEQATPSLHHIELPQELVTKINAMIPEDPTARYEVSPLSREGHAREFRTNLERMDEVIGKAFQVAQNEDERRWLEETLAQVAILAFQAGRRLQAIWYKPFEEDTRRGRGIIKSLSKGGREKAKSTRLVREKVEAKMQKSLAAQAAAGKRPRVTAAAEDAFDAGLGTSIGANEKIWYTRRK